MSRIEVSPFLKKLEGIPIHEVFQTFYLIRDPKEISNHLSEAFSQFDSRLSKLGRIYNLNVTRFGFKFSGFGGATGPSNIELETPGIKNLSNFLTNDRLMQINIWASTLDDSGFHYLDYNTTFQEIMEFMVPARGFLTAEGSRPGFYKELGWAYSNDSSDWIWEERETRGALRVISIKSPNTY